MTGRTIVITGASDGIGAAAARDLAARGERVIVIGRSPDKTVEVARGIGAEHLVADFARLDEVRALAAALIERTDHIDVLANNAGGVFGKRTLTVDGHEMTFQVNHLAPFLLTRLLMDRLRAAGTAKVVVTSSAANRYGRIDLVDLESARRYTPTRAYGSSKLANILFARGLHARHAADGVAAVAFHPGTVATGFAAGSTSVFRWVYRTPLARFMLTSAEQGGGHLVHFVDGTPGVDWQPGAYYDLRRRAAPNPQALDDRLVDALWQRSEAMVG
ncbi:SDR family NAD(P)-dependent oxidoreductase [Cellulomonas fengjieae]|uniref:SDR family NAD(P)-dependent oxidoreductase n=1 Tax=Cellulomonas fengjieae TaxID=2819978 RepID=A0ABS3SLL2_9CELL|nr:SDR family NAD(P)-dependent oxidoreductase [Cellulomonas fengjieae]MBO3086636.1 SDR family NAD(P)-dependent oxidoreductase [Cellulomonas fengjieae]QVI66515.1 SDR family NAD(P)-dependent oxidoreductase [Cellulomonas fengjieae]